MPELDKVHFATVSRYDFDQLQKDDDYFYFVLEDDGRYSLYVGDKLTSNAISIVETFPPTGEAGRFFLQLSTGVIKIWTTEWVQVFPAEKGDTGKSAYQVWLDAGHEGTVEDFFNYLKGPQGAKGDTGLQGPQGPQGVPGPQGETGPTGATGAQGPTGPAGATGLQGPAGADGSTPTIDVTSVITLPAGTPAEARITGTSPDLHLELKIPQGAKGDKGEIGPTGPQGFKGDTGDKGDKGDKGDTGDKGDKGDTGDTGPQGEQGPQGEPGVVADVRVNGESVVDANGIANISSIHFAYVYGIDRDKSVDTSAEACHWVLLNGAYDKDEYPAYLRYQEMTALAALPCHDLKRCVMDNLATAHINYYLHPDDSRKKADGTASILTGADGDVMVEVGTIGNVRCDTYTDDNGHLHEVYLLSADSFNGSNIHPAFYVGAGGATPRKQYIGAFRDVLCNSDGTVKDQGDGTEPKAYASGNKMRSIAGAKPAGNISRANFRNASINNGGTNISTFMQQYIYLLMAIEFANFDTQSTISVGYTQRASFNYKDMRNTGRTAVLGNHTGEIIADDTDSSGVDYDISAASGWNAAAKTNHDLRVVQFSYRGIEDPFGSQWCFEDGIQKYQNDKILGIIVTSNNESTYFARDAESDVTLNMYCWLSGTTKFYTMSATPSVGDKLYSNLTGSVKGTITAADASSVVVSNVAYTRSSTNDTTLVSRAWTSSEDTTSTVYTWIYNPINGTAYSDSDLQTSAGTISDFDGDYSQSGYWCTTDTGKYSYLDTDRGAGAAGSTFPASGYTGNTAVWVSHPWPKTEYYVLDFAPLTWFALHRKGGSSSKGLGNYFYNNTASGARVVFRGGCTVGGSLAGAGYVSVNGGLSYAYANIGSRLAAYAPEQPETEVDEGS